MRTSWPLIGREEEMRLIDTVMSSHSSGVLICGAAGVGKSRIAAEALSSAVTKGWCARWAVGTSSARSLPLGALSEWAGIDGHGTISGVRGVIDALTSTTPDTRVVIGIDDVQLLDDLSAFVIRQIVRRDAAKILLTVRAHERIPPGIREIWANGQFERLDLEPLSLATTATLLILALDGQIDPDAIGRLWKLTRGNLLYLRNIVEREVADGRMVLQREVWRWSGDPRMPPNLVELIESRFGDLPAPVADVVDMLAVGEPIPLAMLRTMTDPVAIEEAENRGLITLDDVHGGGEVRVAHPLYGEVRRERAAKTRLRRLRGMVADQLASTDDADDVRTVVRRATLSVESDLPADAELLCRAAQGAMWMADLALADRLAEAAIRAGAGPEARIIRARALTWLSRGREAEAVLGSIDMAEAADAHRGRLVFVRASNMLWSIGDPAGAKKLVDDEAPTLESRSCVDAFRAVYWAGQGEPTAAANAAAGFDLDALPGIVAAEAAWAAALAAGDSGRLAEALAAVHTGYTVTGRFLEAAQMRFAIADIHVSALLLAGRIAEADHAAQAAVRDGLDLPGAAQLLSRGSAGRAALGAGHLDTACSLLSPVVDALSAASGDNGVFGYRYRFEIPRITAFGMRGSTTDAAGPLTLLDERQFPSWKYLNIERKIASAWLAAAEGAVSEAIRSAGSAASDAREMERFAAEAMCLQTAAQFGDRTSAGRLHELCSLVEGPRVGVATRFAVALRAGDGTELKFAAEDFARIGDLVAAVDAYAHAAVAYRRRGARGAALSCSTRAHEMADACGGADTPALRQVSHEMPVTDREREILELIGIGMATRDVAERLSLSVRTVESHIYRAMAKTGITHRDELARLLRHHGPTKD